MIDDFGTPSRPRTIREIAFDNTYNIHTGAVTERIHFLGPQFVDGSREFYNATTEELDEFVAYWTNQVQVATDYLLNDRNPNTHEWKKEGQ